MLVGLKRSKWSPHERHPFGHARELYMWTFVVALIIAAAFLAYETESLQIGESIAPIWFAAGVRCCWTSRP